MRDPKTGVLKALFNGFAEEFANATVLGLTIVNEALPIPKMNSLVSVGENIWTSLAVTR